MTRDDSIILQLWRMNRYSDLDDTDRLRLIELLEQEDKQNGTIQKEEQNNRRNTKRD